MPSWRRPEVYVRYIHGSREKNPNEEYPRCEVHTQKPRHGQESSAIYMREGLSGSHTALDHEAHEPTVDLDYWLIDTLGATHRKKKTSLDLLFSRPRSCTGQCAPLERVIDC